MSGQGPRGGRPARDAGGSGSAPRPTAGGDRRLEVGWGSSPGGGPSEEGGRPFGGRVLGVCPPGGFLERHVPLEAGP